MKRDEVEKLVAKLVEPIVTSCKLQLVDVEYVREKEWYLRIFIDKPEGIEIDDCQLVSENSFSTIAPARSGERTRLARTISVSSLSSSRSNSRRARKYSFALRLRVRISMPLCCNSAISE